MVALSRDVVGQQGPQGDLQGFPTSMLASADVLWRAHRRDREPWWFSSWGGRFDLAEPRGTCYAARDVEAAVREAAGARLLTAGVVAHAFAAARVVSRIRSSGPVVLADLTDRDAVQHGISRELTPMTPYDIPRQWAEALSAGHGGIEYLSCFTSGDLRSVAIFGSAGVSAAGAVGDPVPFSEAAGRVGITVARTPRIRSEPVPDGDA